MLEIKSISFAYGRHKALDQLSLVIPKGKIFGFVGPNGAGKTTTMKLIAGLLKPQEGEIWLEGTLLSGQPEQIRRHVGYMPDFFGVYDNLLVREYLQFFGELFELSSVQIASKTQELLQLVDLLDVIDKPVDTLSRGMKQRLCLARALMHEPALLLLDEPASGMDPVARIQMKAILKTLSERGQTILISSHILPELSEICDEIGVIHKGKMIQMHSDTASLSSVVKVKLLADSELEAYLENLVSEGLIERYEVKSPSEAMVYISGESEIIAKVASRLSQDKGLLRFEPIVESLEDQFKRLVLRENQVVGGESRE